MIQMTKITEEQPLEFNFNQTKELRKDIFRVLLLEWSEWYHIRPPTLDYPLASGRLFASNSSIVFRLQKR